MHLSKVHNYIILCTLGIYYTTAIYYTHACMGNTILYYSYIASCTIFHCMLFVMLKLLYAIVYLQLSHMIITVVRGIRHLSETMAFTGLLVMMYVIKVSLIGQANLSYSLSSLPSWNVQHFFIVFIICFIIFPMQNNIFVQQSG